MRDLNAIVAARADKDTPPEACQVPTGNVPLIMVEIHAALQKLVETGEPTTIDLSGLPMTPPENAEIDRILGRGEVRAELDVSGPTEIYETKFAGIWRVFHRTSDDQTLGRYIEVTPLPEILKSQPEDIVAGLRRFTIQLDHIVEPEEAQ